MAESDECKTAKTRSNTIASGEEGVRGRIEIEIDPVVAGRGGDTLYSVLCDFVAGVVSSPPSSLFPRIMFSFAKSFPRLQEASRNSSRNLRLWTRRGGSIRAIFVISDGLDSSGSFGLLPRKVWVSPHNQLVRQVPSYQHIQKLAKQARMLHRVLQVENDGFCNHSYL